MPPLFFISIYMIPIDFQITIFPYACLFMSLKAYLASACEVMRTAITSMINLWKAYKLLCFLLRYHGSVT